MSQARSSPPSEWAGATDAGHDIYWSRITDEDASIFQPDHHGSVIVWHWCTSGASGRWAASGTRLHTVVSLDPVQLEPSLLFSCCGVHGFLRGGKWVDA
jgi:hypothetical protein